MKTPAQKLFLPLLTAVALAAAALPARAAEPADDKWRFGVTVPLWAAGIDGDATVRGRTEDVDISFDQLKDHLDASFALGLEARKGRFGIYGGVGYMKFSADSSPADGHVSSDLKFLIADGGVSYLLLKKGEKHPFLLEATAGVRFWYADFDLKVKDRTGAVLLDDSVTQDLVDPMIGLRASQFLTSKLHLDFAGDIGGFGISDNQADLDWSATGMVTYDFAKWFSLSAGYKAVGLDVSRGSGSSEKGINIIMNGALIAAKFQF